MEKVAKEVDSEAKKLIELTRNNPFTFTKRELSKQLDSVEIPVALKSDKQLENAYNLTKNRFIDMLDSNPKNMEGLLKTRKEFDQRITKQF